MPQPFLIPGRCLEVPEIQRGLGERFLPRNPQRFGLAPPGLFDKRRKALERRAQRCGPHIGDLRAESDFKGNNLAFLREN